MSKGVQIAGGATVIALLMAWYAVSNLESWGSFTYFKTVEEFRAAQAEHLGEYARVRGYVVEDSIERDVAARQVRFAVQNDPPHAGGRSDVRLDVVFSSLETPDLFKDGAEVVVEGRMRETEYGAHFQADKVLAKCPSKFEGSRDAPNRAAILN